jgi:hypothetical protein
VLPPSRGKRSEGALAPSAIADAAALGLPALPGTGSAVLLTPLDFNGLDEAPCDPSKTEFPACPIFAFLLVLLASGLRDFEGDPFGLVRDAPRVVLLVGDFRDFLRVFLDIRLPFVAFRGSIIKVLRQTGIRSTAGQIPINR